jgi:SepF-like predicted cell division protein (DUF552 family)
MDQNDLKQIATQTIVALSDNRVMLPSNSIEAITDVKNILRQLVSGQLLLVDPPVVAPPVDAGE